MDDRLAGMLDHRLTALVSSNSRAVKSPRTMRVPSDDSPRGNGMSGGSMPRPTAISSSPARSAVATGASNVSIQVVTR